MDPNILSLFKELGLNPMKDLNNQGLIGLKKEVQDKLLKYQVTSVESLVEKIRDYSFGINLADTGTGKTHQTLALCAELGLRPIVFCNKIMINFWKSICEYFEIEPYDVVNYETIRKGLTYSDGSLKKRKKAQYLSLIESSGESSGETNRSCSYEWKINMVRYSTIVIFDESHMCSNQDSALGALLSSTRVLIENKIPVLLLSATIAQELEELIIPFYLSQMIKTLDKKHFNKFIKARMNSMNIEGGTNYSDLVSAAHILLKKYSVRIRISELGSLFPKNNIICQSYNLENDNGADAVGALYDEIKILDAIIEKLEKGDMLNDLNDLNDSELSDDESKKFASEEYALALKKRQKLRQKIELLKVDIFCKLAREQLREGKSVVIFVNYRKTIQFLGQALDSDSLIYGKIKNEKKEAIIKAFQDNQIRIIICQIKSGGQGISLNDLKGVPRVSFISPPYSAKELIQALGRIHRAGTKSVCNQYIICAANTIEDSVKDKLTKKKGVINTINDGDLRRF
jgi:superfamily II DNA or RNA helicase